MGLGQGPEGQPRVPGGRRLAHPQGRTTSTALSQKATHVHYSSQLASRLDRLTNCKAQSQAKLQTLGIGKVCGWPNDTRCQTARPHLIHM